jgi:hypothetical protein
MNNEELLKKDLAIIIRLASEILLKNDLNIEDVVTQNELENALKIKQLLTVIDNATNTEIPF